MKGTVDNREPQFYRFPVLPSIIFPILLLISVFAIYWRVVKYPFIQDDWFILQSIRSLGSIGYLKQIISVSDNIFYRPIGQFYFLVLYNLFNLNPIGFHIAAILFHTCNSFLVVAIILRITDDRIFSWATGFLYAAAVTIHMDSMLWMVGVYDLGGAFFFFLSFLLFINRRITLSAIFYALALFTKESTIILLPILFAYESIQRKSYEGFLKIIRIQMNILWKHAAVFAFYFVVRIQSLASVSLTSDNPYQIMFTGVHIIDNISLFFKWCLEAINPYFEISLNRILILLSWMIVFIFIHKKSKLQRRQAIFFEVWMVLGLLPVIFLINHFFRYYLTYSLPSFVLLLLYGMSAFMTLFRLNKKIKASVFIVFLSLSVISSSLYFWRLDRLGFNIPTVQGSSNLIRKGAIAQMVHDFLLDKCPQPSKGATFVFNWVPTVAFGKGAGPQIWYGDSTIQVFEVQNIKVDSFGVYIDRPLSSRFEKTYLNPEKTFLIKFHGDYIRRTDLVDFFIK